MDDTTGRVTSLPASDASDAPTDNALAAGTRLHEFEIQRVIGEGGFSLVYVAFDHTLHRTVALKEYIPRALAGRRQDNTVVVHSAHLKPTFEAGMRSFINEARLLAQFDHPALVKVYRFWEGNATAYMAMPLYHGRTLKEVLKDDPARATQAWLKKVIAPVQDALALLHAQRCYHRDISPDNIQLLANDAPVLLDFGAARRTISDRTQAFTAILKPSYAPLEQYAEDSAMEQGPWTDVYALAAVMYAAITQKAPPPSVARIYQDPMQPLTTRNLPGFDPAFLRAIDDALAVRPDDRIRSMHAFAAALGMPAPRSAPPPPDAPPRERRDESTLVSAEAPPIVDGDATLLGSEAPTLVALPTDAPAANPVAASGTPPDALGLGTFAAGGVADETTAALAPPIDEATRAIAADPVDPTTQRLSTVRLDANARSPSDGEPPDDPTIVAARAPLARPATAGRRKPVVAVLGGAIVAAVLGYAGWRAISPADGPEATVPITTPVNGPAAATAPSTSAVTAPQGTSTSAPTSSAPTTTPAVTAPAVDAPGVSPPGNAAPSAAMDAQPSTTTARDAGPTRSEPVQAPPVAAGAPPPSSRPRDAATPRQARERTTPADDRDHETPKGGRNAPARPAPAASPTTPETPGARRDEKCSTLRMRIELGETLTGSERSVLEKECR